MASVQYEKNEEITLQHNFEENANFDEIIKQAEYSLESQELWDQSFNIVAANEGLDKAGAAKNRIRVLSAVLANQTKGPLSLLHKQKWAGHIVKDFPNPLKGTGPYVISSMTDKGVKAGVVYSGKNKHGVECGWLLAFGDTGSTGRRIYAECGRKDKFKTINWDQVEKKLNKGGTVINISDKETGSALYAIIRGAGGKSVVAAAFRG